MRKLGDLTKEERIAFVVFVRHNKHNWTLLIFGERYYHCGTMVVFSSRQEAARCIKATWDEGSLIHKAPKLNVAGI